MYDPRFSYEHTLYRAQRDADFWQLVRRIVLGFIAITALALTGIVW